MTGAGQCVATTNETEGTGVRRGENEAVLVVEAYVKQKRGLFCTREVFFLLTRPLMGDPFMTPLLILNETII